MRVPRPAVPPGPRRIGLQAGHWRTGEVPEELRRLEDSTGTAGGGVPEWQVNLDVANRVATILRARGYQVDVLPTTIPPDYLADVFLALHADGSPDPGARGFKAAHGSRRGPYEGRLVQAITEEYRRVTGLPVDPIVSRNMLGYYAFSWSRLQSTVAPHTPAAILEMGFMTNAADRALLVGRQDLVAEAVANGIQRFLDEVPAGAAFAEDLILPPLAPAPPTPRRPLAPLAHSSRKTRGLRRPVPGPQRSHFSPCAGAQSGAWLRRPRRHRRRDPEARYEPDDAGCKVSVLDGEQAVAMLRVIRLTMRLREALVPMAGIADVRTHPAHRRQGHARRLFAATLEYMRRERYAVSLLFGISDFYWRFGYAPVLPEYDVSLPTRHAERLVASRPARRRHRAPRPARGRTGPARPLRPRQRRTHRHPAAPPSRFELEVSRTWRTGGSTPAATSSQRSNGVPPATPSSPAIPPPSACARSPSRRSTSSGPARRCSPPWPKRRCAGAWSGSACPCLRTSP